MKKIALSMAVAALTIGIAMAVDKDTLTKDQLQKLVQGNKLLQLNKKLTPSKGKDLDSVYYIQFTAPNGRKIDGFLDKKTGALYMGGGYDKDGKRITFPYDRKVVDEAVAFTIGDGSKDLYIVTDPECPYCRKFEREAKDKLKDYKVHVILFPLRMHKNAKPMSAYIMAGKDNAEKAQRFKETLAGSDAYAKANVDVKTLDDYLKKSNAAVSELGVRGTPTFFVVDENGNLKKSTWPQILGK